MGSFQETSCTAEEERTKEEAVARTEGRIGGESGESTSGQDSEAGGESVIDRSQETDGARSLSPVPAHDTELDSADV